MAATLFVVVVVVNDGVVVVVVVVATPASDVGKSKLDKTFVCNYTHDTRQGRIRHTGEMVGYEREVGAGGGGGRQRQRETEIDVMMVILYYTVIKI